MDHANKAALTDDGETFRSLGVMLQQNDSEQLRAHMLQLNLIQICRAASHLISEKPLPSTYLGEIIRSAAAIDCGSMSTVGQSGTGGRVWRKPRLDGVVNSVDVNYAASLVAATAQDGFVYLVDTIGQRERLRIDVAQYGVSCLALSSDSTRLVAGAHEPILGIWSVCTGDLLHKLKVPASGVDTLAITHGDPAIVVSGAYMMALT